MNRRDILKGTLLAPLMGLLGCKSTSTKTNKLYITPVDDQANKESPLYKGRKLVDWNIIGDFDYQTYCTHHEYGRGNLPTIDIRLVLTFDDLGVTIEETYGAFNPGGNTIKKIANWVISVKRKDIEYALSCITQRDQQNLSDIPVLPVKGVDFKLSHIMYGEWKVNNATI